MKLITITFLASLFLFSCSDDDGDGSASGWTAEQTNTAVATCVKDGSTEETCKCQIQETAKVVSFDQLDKITDTQAAEILVAVLKNCGGEGVEVTIE